MRNYFADSNFRALLDPTILFIRLWLGIIIIKHSASYIFGGKMKEFATYLEGLGFPFPVTNAYFSQWIELIGAIIILLGLRFGAIMLAVILGTAVIFAHKMRIFQDGELVFNYFLLSLVISFIGCGKFSLDHHLFKKNRVNTIP